MSELTTQERTAIARLHALLELLPSELDRQLADTGITSFEFTLLEALSEAERSRLRLSALASRTNATLPRLSRVVSALERKGLVMRAPCDDDGRAINAVLTSAGESAYARSRPLYDDAVRRLILDGLDDDGVSSLASLTFSMLSKLDPQHRMAVTADGSEPVCAADPVAQSV